MVEKARLPAISVKFPFPVIDAHVHLPLGNATPHQWFPFTRSRADYFRYLKKLGIDTFLSFPSGPRRVKKGTRNMLQETNEAMIKFWKQHRDLVIPAVRVHPRMPKESVSELEKARKEGVVFVGELATYGRSDYTYEDPGFETILEAADDLGMILNCHLLAGQERPFERHIERYRGVVFMLAHLWDDAELVRNKAEMVARHPNACVDISGYGVDRLGIWEYVVKTMGAEKVLWGSDYPINDPAIYLARLDSARITAAEKKKVAGGNILRMLKERNAPLPPRPKK